MDSHPSVGQVVDHHYQPIFIVLSYMTSVIGCWTTLELLQRRTSIHGLYNWYLLLAASLTMSSVGIWSMHYVGNCAIVMADGDQGLQIVYNGGFTAGSLLVPVSLVGGAFFVFSISEKVSILRTLIGGFLVGLGICGMHYLGQVSIINYKAEYVAANIAGAAVIAVAASTIALGLFFYLNSTWTNNWLKRLACAWLLAAGVSGMHWVASVGTSYQDTVPSKEGSHSLSRRDTAIIVTCLAFGCCIVLMFFAILWQRSKKQSATRAKEVILASATFDTEGRLMVNPDGLLPCEKITNSYLEGLFDEPFGVGHPVFCWLFRLTHCWIAICESLPAMYKNVGTASTSETSAMHADFGLSDGNQDYETFFKQLFCVAACNLATTFHDKVDNMGVLFGDICSTGTVTRSNALKRLAKTVLSWIRRRRNLSNFSQAEQGNTLDDDFGQGQLLFLVRRIEKPEAGRLAAIGYRFAPIAHVVDYLAESWEITSRELLPRLEQMRGIAGKEMLLEAGVHVACFALRPVFRRGFDVLVRKDAKNLLPSIRLPIEKLSTAQFNLLRQFDGLTVAACLVQTRCISTPSTQDEETFCTMFFDALTKLRIQLKDSFFDDARLMAQVLIAPCPQVSSNQRLEFASIIAFRTITDVHGLGNVDRRFEYIPCPFFLTEQKVYLGFSDNEQFATEVREGFGGQIKRTDPTTGALVSVGPSSQQTGNENRSNRYRPPERLSRSRRFPFVARARKQTPTGDYSSTRNLVRIPSSDTRLGTANTSIDDVQRGNTPDIEMTIFNASQGTRASFRNFAEELVSTTVKDGRELRQNNAGPTRYLSNH